MFNTTKLTNSHTQKSIQFGQTIIKKHLKLKFKIGKMFDVKIYKFLINLVKYLSIIELKDLIHILFYNKANIS